MAESSLVVRQIEPKKWWSRSKWRVVESGYVDGYDISKDFVSDAASVPFIFRLIFSPVGKYFDEAILHDFLLQRTNFDRKRVDTIFYHALKMTDIKPWRIEMLYFAVRLKTATINLGNKFG